MCGKHSVMQLGAQGYVAVTACVQLDCPVACAAPAAYVMLASIAKLSRRGVPACAAPLDSFESRC